MSFTMSINQNINWSLNVVLEVLVWEEKIEKHSIGTRYIVDIKYIFIMNN